MTEKSLRLPAEAEIFGSYADFIKNEPVPASEFSVEVKAEVVEADDLLMIKQEDTEDREEVSKHITTGPIAVQRGFTDSNKCKKNKKPLEQENSLKQINLYYTNDDVAATGVVNDGYDLLEDEMDDENVIFRCGMCFKVFNTSLELRKHMQSHAHQRPTLFECRKCSKTFTLLSNYRRHQLFHSGKQFSCSLCHLKFKQKHYVVRHIQKVHTKTCKLNEKEFVCKLCRKVVKTAFALRSHVRIHTGEKPFTCEVCKKGFSNKWNLTVHLNVHNKEQVTCKLCSKTFTTNSCLSNLMKQHGDCVQCDVCDKYFKTKFNLSRHLINCHKGS